MKRNRSVIPLVVILLIAAINCGGEEPVTVQPPPSPQVHTDGWVTFNILAPRAREVLLTVINIPDTLAMTREEGGVWSITIGPLEPEIWEYSFIVDGVTAIDTQNAWVKDEPQPMMSMVEIPGETPAFYDIVDVPHGVVTIHTFLSPVLGIPRTFRVYIPPGYDESGTETYPVLYLFHGGAGDDRGWTTMGRANYILDNLIAGGMALPMIIVMPNGQYRGDNVPAGGYERDLLEVIVPMVEQSYRVDTNPAARAMAGLSMGGSQTLDIGIRHQDMFTSLGVFSSGIRDTYESTHGGYYDTANDNLNLFWLGMGEDDGGIERFRALLAFLGDRGVVHTSTISSGAHEWNVWRRYLRDFAPMLFRR